MDGSTSEIIRLVLAVSAAGIAIGWLLRAAVGKKQVSKLGDGLQDKIDDITRQRDRLTAESNKLRTRVEEQQTIVHRHEVAVGKAKTELASAREREKRMSQDLFTLRGEREEFKSKVLTFQNALITVKQQTADLQSEFIKSREFYKGELRKSFELRKAVEMKLDDARAEHESFNNLLHSSRSEHESVNRMLASAQARLANLDELEAQVIRLEAENAQLNHDARLTQQEIEVLKRDVAELEELKVQNRELAHCLESMESSRRQYENDAQRYKQYADQTEKKSETLRLRLDEVEKNFADIEKQQRNALREARQPASPQSSNGHAASAKEVDNLQEIVGIGKVFEKALNDLGVYSFRQLAAFGATDIARVNRELKECRGRLEQDDWIGQAKELYFKKYGGAAVN